MEAPALDFLCEDCGRNGKKPDSRQGKASRFLLRNMDSLVPITISNGVDYDNLSARSIQSYGILISLVSGLYSQALRLNVRGRIVTPEVQNELVIEGLSDTSLGLPSQTTSYIIFHFLLDFQCKSNGLRLATLTQPLISYLRATSHLAHGIRYVLNYSILQESQRKKQIALSRSVSPNDEIERTQLYCLRWRPEALKSLNGKFSNHRASALSSASVTISAKPQHTDNANSDSVTVQQALTVRRRSATESDPRPTRRPSRAGRSEPGGRPR